MSKCQGRPPDPGCVLSTLVQRIAAVWSREHLAEAQKHILMSPWAAPKIVCMALSVAPRGFLEKTWLTAIPTVDTFAAEYVHEYEYVRRRALTTPPELP